MKYPICLLSMAAVASLSSCVAPAPEPLPPERVLEHHYHTRRVYVPAPGRHSSDSAESFRAVERPGSYSQ